ncbi:hypothetical protein NQ176_g3307 [Zarea fungicola]|uniref:Uncharacterized protein n=1 Tax=Zarea fungicola TaxID=93591 RepID=A0ACC1NKA9_9HYPO|nr:hypothetical protein NQ176_g3307 [Lecanicillium fungicola]
MPDNYKYIKVEVAERIGTITLNRPDSLNAFTQDMLTEALNAVRELNEHPDTVFTVLTGEGRFFSAGADIRGEKIDSVAHEPMTARPTPNLAILEVCLQVKTFQPVVSDLGLSNTPSGVELMRALIDQRKVFVLALNGPGVGGGGGWFPGIADVVLAADSTYIQVPFSSLGLVPENGGARTFAQTIGVHRANEIFMFGKKVTAQELRQWGLVAEIFPTETFHRDVKSYLKRQLSVNDGESMILARKLQNEPLRAERMIALYDAADALTERIVDGAPARRFKAKASELEAKSKKHSKL